MGPLWKTSRLERFCGIGNDLYAFVESGMMTSSFSLKEELSMTDIFLRVEFVEIGGGGWKGEGDSTA